MTNYNPFKMILPYLGAFLGVGYNVYACGIENHAYLKWCGVWSFKGALIGFIIGWIITALYKFSLERGDANK